VDYSANCRIYFEYCINFNAGYEGIYIGSFRLDGDCDAFADEIYSNIGKYMDKAILNIMYTDPWEENENIPFCPDLSEFKIVVLTAHCYTDWITVGNSKIGFPCNPAETNQCWQWYYFCYQYNELTWQYDLIVTKSNPIYENNCPDYSGPYPGTHCHKICDTY
jgi:hypothetical protein